MTKKINDRLDNANEDAAWWEESVWEPHQDNFLESVNGEDCFTPNAFKWALALVNSRNVFLDRCLRLIPILDLAIHGMGRTPMTCRKSCWADPLGHLGRPRGPVC